MREIEVQWLSGDGTARVEPPSDAPEWETVIAGVGQRRLVVELLQGPGGKWYLHTAPETRQLRPTYGSFVAAGFDDRRREVCKALLEAKKPVVCRPEDMPS
jgi:hypothetical protein